MNMEESLDCRISGFHQYRLSEPAGLAFASRNLCEMLGRTREELMAENGYISQVHPGDRQVCGDFLRDLAAGEQTLTAQYRLLRMDGSVLCVSDTATSYWQDGVLLADSVLTDITALKSENENLHYLNDTMPCGFLRYTCEKTPRITYINDQMREFLGFPRGAAGTEALEMYSQNLFLLIPMEERRRFGIYLDRVYKHGAPIAGEMPVIRCDGTRTFLFGWVTKCVNERGEEEFQSACMDITERHQLRREQETRRYVKALTEIYDKIFEFDLSARTVKCLCGSNSPMFRWIENIPMQMEEATDKWIVGSVCGEDRQQVRDFFRAFYQKKLSEADGRPPQITYRALSSGGVLRTYTGIFLKLDANVSLYCCRNMPETDALRSENATLKNMQQLVMRFTEGVVAFEVEGDTVKPLYTSENVCSFFGYSREDWLTLTEKRPTIREFIAQSGLDYEDIKKLFAVGEAEFTYFDMTRNAYRRIKAICSRKDSDEGFYVMLYNVDGRETAGPEDIPEKSVRIRTFGYFDVFVDDKPIAFRNEKSKELFALLVDRRGGFVSSEEAISFLWEDEPANSVTLARYRKVALRLKNLLEEYGIGGIVESVNGKRRLVTERVRCDLYDYLSGREEYAQLFKGSYLTNYTWGETTLAELTGEHLLPLA
ncbi:MAG: PAS domain-containing protein [Oscillospiraceae bacterium]|nr:PAS domain-containing protein [Oscillospiraceae bacterium]